ncbi:MAG: AAA family ATPase [Deltaproteobacteria bacterium]|nr:AAA family ATPase [Deltaproteobacteria bacterium]
MDRDRVHKNILLTGPPGCGKSTLIEKTVQRIGRPSTGFFTRDIRDRGRRVGFSITTLDGKEGILAHVDIRGRKRRVGRYGVNLRDIDTIAVPSLIPEDETVVVVVDEIGKMECLSDLFRQTLTQVLDAPNSVVGSIALKGDAFINAIKKRPDTRLITVLEKNRDRLVEEVLRRY